MINSFKWKERKGGNKERERKRKRERKREKEERNSLEKRAKIPSFHIFADNDDDEGEKFDFGGS